MAWLRSHRDENIDPNNAPAPVMPLDEPAHEAPDLDDGMMRLKRREARERFADAAREAAHTYRPPEHDRHAGGHHAPNTPAPDPALDDPVATTAPTSTDASPIHGGLDAPMPSWEPHRAANGGSDEEDGRSPVTTSSSPAPANEPAPPGRQSWQHPSDQVAAAEAHGTTSRKRHRTCSYYIGILILIGIFGFGTIGSLLSSCAANVGSFVEGFFDEDAPRYTEIEEPAPAAVDEAVENAAQTETKQRLDAMIAGESHELDRFAEGVTALFRSYCGATPEELGLDAREIALWQLGHTTYTLTEAYAFLTDAGDGYEGTATVYFELSTPDVGTLALELAGFLPNGYLGEGEASTLSSEDLQAIRAAYDELTAGEPAYRELSSSMDFEAATDSEGGNCAIAVDEEAWADEVAWFARA